MATLLNLIDLNQGTIINQYESQGLQKIAKISAGLMNILHSVIQELDMRRS